MDVSKLSISNMTLTDFDEIKDTLNTDYDEFWNADVLKEELQSENSHYIAARINNNIVAFAGIKVVLDDADVMNIVTRKDCRNLGIGTYIFEQLLRLAKENDIKKITLEVNENNSSAIHLYEKFGFEKIAVRKNYYNNVENAIIMQLWL